MILTDTQLVLLKIIDIETFCDLETDLDFGRDEIFARIEQVRIKRNSDELEHQRLKDFDDLCALICHPSPDISLVIMSLIITRYRVPSFFSGQAMVGIGTLLHYRKVCDRSSPLVIPSLTFDYHKYCDILAKHYNIKRNYK